MNCLVSPAVDLDDRIAASFTGDVKSENIANLIKEVEGASRSFIEFTERTRTRALDPSLSVSEVAEARREMEDAQFRLERLQAAIEDLGSA
jgi:hypothetical protein